jgi:ATP-binding cassette subfamily B protein
MGDSSGKRLDPRTRLRHLWPVVRTRLDKVVLAASCLVAASIASSLSIILTARFFDAAIPSKSWLQIGLVLGGILASSVFAAALLAVQGYATATIAEGVTTDLRNAVFARIQILPYAFFVDGGAANLQTRFSSDFDAITGFLAGTLVMATSSAITICAGLATALSLNPVLALTSVVACLLMTLPSLSVTKNMYNYRRSSRANRDRLAALMDETVSAQGFLLMKSFSREKIEFDRFREIGQATVRDEIRLVADARRAAFTMSVGMALGPALILAVGAWLVLQGRSTVGDIFAFTLILGRIAGPSSTLLGINIQMTTSMASLDRCLEYFEIETEPAGGDRLDVVRGEIRFADVTFGHMNPREHGVVRGLDRCSLLIEPGKTLGITGKSGSGKTTMAMLLTRFIEPEAGTISLDGVDLRSLSASFVRSAIGQMTQDTFLIDGTIEQNIRYGRIDATKAEVEQAARNALIHDFVMSLPQHYDTRIGTRGLRLSGGERQRLGLARILLRDPRVLLLDEPTSSLDAEGARMVHDAISNASIGRTTLIISHRLSSIASADSIIVLDAGRIVERGTHDELLRFHGIYQSLHEQQMAHHF